MLKKLLAFFLVLTLAVTLAPSGAAGWPAAGQTEPFARLEAEREARLAAMAAPFSPAPERSSAAAPAADSSTMGYIVRFRPGMPEAGIERLLGPYDYKMIGPSSLKIFSFHSGQSLAQLESAFAGSVEYIVPDGKSKIQAAPSDTYFGKQWALRTTNVTGAWNISKGSADVLVAVIDSGIKRSHEDFAGRDVKQGWDYLENKAVARDSCGHGTNVTGLIAAATDNARGIAGVCWNVAVLPMLVVDEDGYADTSDICAAVIDAADLDADVINISIGSGDFSQAESDAAAYAIAKGCVVVASAGNDGNDGYNYPASYPGVISAAAVDDASQVADFSNCNDAVDVAAPGVEVLTTADRSIDHQDYIYADGTSFSAPIVAGVAALAKACNPNVNAYMFLDLIKNTSLDRGEQGYDNYYGYGLIDAGKLLERLLTFKTSNGYTYAVSGSSAKILGYAGTDAALNVMGRLGGYPVVSIGEYAFAGNDKMQSLTLPNSLTVIGQRAFYMCRELKTATLGSGLSGLNENVFDACGKLASVAVDAGNPSLSSANGMLYNRDKTRLILCPEGRTGTVAIPAGVTLIGDYAFEDCGLLADVLFPQSLKEIGEGAFLGCGELMAFDIPDSVVKIGWDAFEGTGWYNGRSSPSLVYAGKVAYAYKGVMPYGTRVVLRAGTRGVAAAAFYGCSSLESITIPSTVVCIGKWAFENCNSLSGAAVPQSVAEIGEYAFGYEYDGSEDIRLDGFTLYCSAGSAALKYAKDNGVGYWVPAAPGSPKAVSAGYNSAKITWSKPAGATGSLIYRAASAAGPYTRVGSSSSDAFTDINLTCGKTYYYKVITYTTVDTVNTYSSASAAVSAKPVPSVPANFKAARASASSIKLTWSPVAGASGYVLYRYNGAKAAYERLKVTTLTSFTHSGLVKGRTYTYKVRAYTTVGGANVYGSPSAAVSAKTY